MSRTLTDPNYNWRVRTWFPELSEETHQLLESYFHFIIQQNKTASIIATKTIINADLVHFADSICACQIVREKINKNIDLYDIGSGAGFPGLVYGILYPDQRVVLIESEDRKFKFLQSAVDALKLKNILVVGRKVETLPQDSIGQAICRDFMPLPRMLLTLRKLVKKGGVIFHMKSDEWSLEVSDIPTQLCSSWIPGLEQKYELPTTDARLFVVRTDKIQ